MSDYKPTEYIVDFGDYRSSRFVELSMALIEQNGAKLGERIVRCRDCRYADWDITAWWCTRDKHNPFKIGELRGYGERSQLGGFCAWACPKEHHKDENKENNHVSNLEWCTAAYNNVYGTRIERVEKTKAKSNDERRGDA